ncbi:hypothetical protein N657DRAFT_246598 [Parathielavia appendiculata]|uniref:Uncharacterized protein n=1 Tax=Parathielavia appendiculata TaxID=2587402 RepID=A0AAN6TTN1_9PEZI|nr:hypothetical protein N657DRAFT_246598 [Parathielavia appendiculata]
MVRNPSLWKRLRRTMTRKSRDASIHICRRRIKQASATNLSALIFQFLVGIAPRRLIRSVILKVRRVTFAHPDLRP